MRLRNLQSPEIKVSCMLRSPIGGSIGIVEALVGVCIVTPVGKATDLDKSLPELSELFFQAYPVPVVSNPPRTTYLVLPCVNLIAGSPSKPSPAESASHEDRLRSFSLHAVIVLGE